MSQMDLFGCPRPTAPQVDQPTLDVARPLPPVRRARRPDDDAALEISAPPSSISSLPAAPPSTPAGEETGEGAAPDGEYCTLEEALAMLRDARKQAQEHEELRSKMRERFPAGTDPMPVEAFLMEHGRLPRVEDDPSPWSYLGWLRPYVQGLHHLGGVEAKILPDRKTWTPAPGQKGVPLLGFPDRWGYYQRTLAAGRLLPEPIPRVEFQGPDPAVFRETEAWLRPLEHDGQGWSALSSLVDFLGFALGTSRRRPKVGEAASEQLYRQIKMERWLQHPSDYLAQLIMDRFGGGPNAFFATPHAVVECMARMLFIGDEGELTCDERDPRARSVNEPCLGSGRMLLHASNYSMNLCGQDKDPFVLEAAKINFAVYAPWALYGLPFLDKEDRKDETP